MSRSRLRCLASTACSSSATEGQSGASPAGHETPACSAVAREVRPRHAAFVVKDIVEAVRHVRAAGAELLSIPANYCDDQAAPYEFPDGELETYRVHEHQGAGRQLRRRDERPRRGRAPRRQVPGYQGEDPHERVTKVVDRGAE